jgi:hypothetical protein
MQLCNYNIITLKRPLFRFNSRGERKNQLEPVLLAIGCSALLGTFDFIPFIAPLLLPAKNEHGYNENKPSSTNQSDGYRARHLRFATGKPRVECRDASRRDNPPKTKTTEKGYT